MQINLDIDDELLTQAMAATGLPTRQATIEQGLRDLVQRQRRLAAFDAMKGAGWDGDLDVIRGRKEPDV